MNKREAIKNEVAQLKDDLETNGVALESAEKELDELEQLNDYFGKETEKKRIKTEFINGQFQTVPVIDTDPPEAKQARKKRIRQLENKEIPTLRSDRKKLESRLNKIGPIAASEDPPESLDNPDAVFVDFKLSGVTPRKPSSDKELTYKVFHIDPVFAVAMAQYLEHIKTEYGVSDINFWFNRAPKSATDKHAPGYAVDIHGFTVHGHHLQLGQGKEMDKEDEKYDANHSDWYNDEDKIPELENITYADFLKNQTEVMVDYFGFIMSPYSGDTEHQTHYHVQLRGWAGREGAIDGLGEE